MSIRVIQPEDRDPLLSVLHSDGTFRPDEIEVALELIDDSIAGSRDYQIAVVEDSELGVAGYICWGPTPMTKSTFDLYWIVTHKEARGQGIASRLILHMEQEIQKSGGGHVRVETSEQEGYGAARRFYKKMDYPEQAVFPDFYSHGDGLIVYYKRV